ncbi:MAG: uridylate kinase, partial [Chloroflexia bacterium]|nr:uridylate kinase [Chloroflexia bacterium]
MTTFIKFGGSVITDKRIAESADHDAIARMAQAIAAARTLDPQLRLVLSHGSGSYGHVAAARYGIHKGLASDADWFGFAATSAAALRLNRLMVDALLAANIPAWSLQPSTTVETANGKVVAWHTDHIAQALHKGLVPVVHGDVSFDRGQGCAIASTEMLLQWLCGVPALAPTRIILVGESAVYTADPHRDPHAQRIPHIHRDNIAQVLGGAGGSYGIDVTGGMQSKLTLMWQLVTHNPLLTVCFVAPDSQL